MMNRYQKEVEQICANELWKQRMINTILQKQNEKKKKPMLAYAVAFCIICILGAGVLRWIPEKKQPVHYVDSLPVLSLQKPAPRTGSVNCRYCTGFEGIDVYDEKELQHLSFYDFSKPLDNLPVIKNKNVMDKYGYFHNSMTKEEQEKKLKKYADILGMEHYEITTSTKKEERSELKNENIRITLEDGGESVFVWYEFPNIKENSVLLVNKNWSIEKIKKTVRNYCLDYKELFQIENPLVDVRVNYGVSQNNKVEKGYSIEVYETEKNPVDKFVSQLQSVSLYTDEDGYLYGYRINQKDTSTSIGNYPIKSLEEAKAELHSGKYRSDVGSMPGITIDLDEIAYSELVYLDDESLDYFLPYYKFYVPVEYEDDYFTKHQISLKEYGAFYVPAIESKYLKESK